jgi:hypothetical protein
MLVILELGLQFLLLLVEHLLVTVELSQLKFFDFLESAGKGSHLIGKGLFVFRVSLLLPFLGRL